MRKIIAILFLSTCLFSIEFFIYNYVSPWLMPNLLLLFIVFVNLWLGIRYSIFAAIFAGLLKDSFSTDFLGFHMFTFVVCAYTATMIYQYYYQKGSIFYRWVLVGSIVCINFILQFFLHLSTSGIGASFIQVLIPELLLTLLVTEFVFASLRICASKLFV